LQKQAKKNEIDFRCNTSSVDVGGNDITRIADVNRAKADLRNILGAVPDKNEDGLYKIGTKVGVVDKLYCR
jgi:hypothetical protein